MALITADRVRETTTTSGTGSVTLLGAVLGFQSFAAIGNGNNTYYCIADPTTGAWEVGIGTYTASGTTLSRDTVLSNSLGTTAKINFAGNVSDVFVTYPSSRAIYTDAAGSVITPSTASTLAVGSGGTGLSSGTSGGVPYFSSSSAISSSAALTANALVVGGGAGAAPSTVTTGTGVVTALGVNTGTAGAFVVNGGALGTPSSGTLTNATGLPIDGGTTGTLPATRGGTGLTSGTSGGVPYYSSGTTIASSAALASNALVVGGGAGVAPSTTTTGTGVLTALGVNTGTAGAFVVNGGALGTPSSGTLSSCTGLPLSTGVSGTLPIANGGTGQTSAPAANAALTGFTTTATAGATTTLTNASSYYQVFTGTLNQTVQLPATSTLAQGWSFHIVNNSTGTLTVQTSTAVSLGTIPSGVTVMVTALTTTGNTAADWELGYTDFSSITGTGANVLATSPTLTTPTIGVATATSINKVAITAPATSATLTIADGKTLTASNTLTLAGTDSTTMTFPATSQTIAGLAVASQVFTTAQTFRAASAVRSEAASTQDAMVLAGRAGGTSSYAVTLTPTTLTASRTVTFPDAATNIPIATQTLTFSGPTAARTYTLPDAATTLVGTDTTQTLTNKDITPRVSSTTSITSPLAWNSDNFDQYAATAQSTSFTISADAGTPTDGQKAIFRFKDNGTTRTITFTGGVSKGFTPVGVTLTTSGSNYTYATTASKVVYFGCVYNTNSSRWDIVALSQE